MECRKNEERMKPLFGVQVILCFLVAVYLIIFTAVPLYGTDRYRGIKRKTDFSHKSGKIGKYTALIIGIDDYADKKIPDLKTAGADADAVAKVLKERYGFKDITVLKDRQATKSAIIRAFRNCIRNLGSNDSLLIYYAGHGELDRLVGDGWWVPADADAGDIATYFENTTVQKYLRAMKTRHVLLVSDSCYSGTLFGESRVLPGVIDDRFYLDLYNEKSRWGMTSGNKTPVTDTGFGGHSVFAYQFIRRLEKNRKPYVTPREIYTAIGPVIRNNSGQMPMCRPIKMTGDMGGEFVFILAGSGGAVVEKPEKKTILRVRANVGVARVFLNGKEKGGVPISFEGIRPGTYQVKVVADGYESYEKRVNISIGRESEVAAWLEKKAVKSRLFVNTEPENADVRILNIRPKFYQGMDLELGDYHLEVSADRCERVRKWITLYEGKYEGKYETVHFSLNCKPEKVEVDDSKYEAFLKAEEFFHKRDYSQALESYNDYLSEFPDGHYAPAALMKEGTIYTESGKYSTARNIYQYLINRYPDSPLVPDARVVILSTYYKEGEYDRVIRRTENVLKNIVSEDHIFITHVLCGDAYMASGSPINAVYFYITACKKKFGTVPCPDGETENVSAKMNIAIKRLSPADIKALQERLDDDSVGYVIPVGHR